jgi:sec-independent protein translocase protein TatB
MARHFQSGIDAMIREAELEEMEQKWREENERIMREHPLADEPMVELGPEREAKAYLGLERPDEPPLPLAPPQRELP